MKEFFGSSAPVRRQIARAGSGKKLFLVDFDGTLSPLVKDYLKARIGQGVVPAIERLKRAGWTVAVLSGRGLDFLRARVGIRGILYGGNHGWEWTGEMRSTPGLPPASDVKRAREFTRRAAELLRRHLAKLPDTRIEEKRFFAVVHHRSLAGERAAEFVHAFQRARAEKLFEGCRWRHGKDSWELLGPVRWGKGKATRLLLRKLKPAVVIAAGDDLTDEDMFAAVPPKAGATVNVGGRPGSTARYCLTRQDQIVRFIDFLARSSVRPRTPR